jgi:hypothetical protein
MGCLEVKPVQPKDFKAGFSILVDPSNWAARDQTKCLTNLARRVYGITTAIPPAAVVAAFNSTTKAGYEKVDLPNGGVFYSPRSALLPSSAVVVAEEDAVMDISTLGFPVWTHLLGTKIVHGYYATYANKIQMTWKNLGYYVGGTAKTTWSRVDVNPPGYTGPSAYYELTQVGVTAVTQCLAGDYWSEGISSSIHAGHSNDAAPPESINSIVVVNVLDVLGFRNGQPHIISNGAWLTPGVYWIPLNFVWLILQPVEMDSQ